jgi:hypothetical protein
VKEQYPFEDCNQARTLDGSPLVAGVNKDHVDIGAGLTELKACDWTDPHTVMVINFALARWARGEEAAAERMAIDKSFHGIDLTSWRRVLAAAVASGNQKAAAA